MIKINRLYVSIGLTVLGLGLVYFMASVVVPRVLVTMTKAAPASKVSLTRSYFIGGKLLARADGVDGCVVNVFALDETGKGVKEKNVEIFGDGIETLSKMTGIDGLASFSIKSTREGQYKLEASIEGIPVGKSVVVTFRN